MPTTRSTYLEVEGVTKSYGGVRALDAVTVGFEPGIVTAIIGPNGAGKTTLFNVICGFVEPDAGSVYLCDAAPGGTISVRRDLTGMPPDRISRHGVGVLFQTVRMFGGLSVLDNVLVAERAQSGENPLRALAGGRALRASGARSRERAMVLLEQVGLADVHDRLADHLSFGQQKLAAIARLLMSDAQVILLDEPTSGVSPAMVEQLLRKIQELAEVHGRTVLMIEHDLRVVEQVGDWVYLLSRGAVEVFGVPEEVLRRESLARIFRSYEESQS